MSSRIPVLTLMAGLILATAQAHADHQQGHVLPEIVVEAEGYAPLSPSLTSPDIELARELIEKTPGGVDVIDADEYKDGRTSSVSDALKFSPGVYVQPRFGAEEARLSIRGSGIQRTFHLRGISL